MTQYKRITGKVFGGNATATGNDPEIAQFGSALAGTFVGTTDVETIQQLPAWGKGFISAVTPDTQFPALPETTGALKVLSHQICNILQEGVSTWDSGTIYYKGNYVSKNGNLFVSKTDTNQGDDPETDNSNWTNPIDGQWVYKRGKIFKNLNAGTYTVDLSSLLPNDGYAYELLILSYLASIHFGVQKVYVDNNLALLALCDDSGQTTGRFEYNMGIVPLFGRTLTVENTETFTTDSELELFAYRRIGTNK